MESVSVKPQKGRLHMKNKILMIVLAVALFIPSVVAVVSFNKVKNDPVSEKNIQTLTIADLAGNEFVFARDDEDDQEMIDLFFEMNQESAKKSSLPDPLVGTAFFKVTMKSMQQEAEYQYYFSTDADEAYFVDGKTGSVYAIPEEYASKFIESRYAVSLYVNAVVPTLSVSDSSKVLPTSAVWEYKNSAKSYVNCEPELASSPQSVSMEGGLDLIFSLRPDHFNVKLTDTANGAVLFNDQYDRISSLSIDKSVVLQVEIDAKWYEDAARDYRGEMKYSFTANIAAPAEFFLADPKLESGRFTTISARNISDLSKLQFSSNPDIGYTPTFFMEGDVAVALLPVSCDLAAGNYTLTLKYGGVTEELGLEVTARNIRHFNYSISAAVLKSTRTEKTLADFAALRADITKTASAERYWDGMFVEPVVKASAHDGVITTGYGHLRKITGTDISYTHMGVDYIRSKGSEVFAGNKGKVVYAGYSELAGNTVVIEHGYGLKTWYSHLSEINVSVGDIVEKGAAIGIVGSTGFTNQTGVHAGMSIYDIAVSPYTVWYDNEIVIIK